MKNYPKKYRMIDVNRYELLTSSLRGWHELQTYYSLNVVPLDWIKTTFIGQWHIAAIKIDFLEIYILIAEDEDDSVRFKLTYY